MELLDGRALTPPAAAPCRSREPAYAVEPLEGVLRVVDSDSLEEVDSIDVEGVPYDILVVGGNGLTH